MSAQNSPKIVFLYFLLILFTIFNISDIKILNLSNFTPLFDLMMIYYFTIHRANIFGFLFIALIGIWGDAINSIPLGISSLCYIILIKMFNIINQRMFLKESFNNVFRQFILFSLLFISLKWAILSLYFLNIYDFTMPLIRVIISILLYPAFHKIMNFLEKLTANKEF